MRKELPISSMSKVASVINFCTYDLRFLDRCIRSVSLFSDQILIPICDHLFNGEKEDRALLNAIYLAYPEVDFVEYAYSEKELYGTPARHAPYSPGWSTHWHNTSRLVGSYFVNPEIDKVLFLDVDEIFSSPLPKTHHDALRFATFWYFRRADNCASVYPDGPLLISKHLLTTELLINPDERMGMYAQVEGEKEREYCVDGRPIVHHYSFVRPEDELRKKVSAWGHHWERDWEALLKESGDFVRGYEYQKVAVYWDPLMERPQLQPKGKIPSVACVTAKDIFRREIRELL